MTSRDNDPFSYVAPPAMQGQGDGASSYPPPQVPSYAYQAPLSPHIFDKLYGYRGALRGATIGTGAYVVGNTALGIVNALWSGAEVFDMTQGMVALFVLTLLLGGAIAGYVTLGLWMKRTREIQVAMGDPVPAPWQIWGSWFIPVYALWGPYKAMSALARRAYVSSALATWWFALLMSSLLSNIGNNQGIDPSLSRTLILIEIPVFIVSWVALLQVMRRTTDAVESAANALASAPPPLAMPTASAPYEQQPPHRIF